MELVKHYERILRKLEGIPETSSYRINTEKLIKERQAIVQANSNRDDIESKLNDGCCEEMIYKCQLEVDLIETMKKYKPWEPLEQVPPANQWKWPL